MPSNIVFCLDLKKKESEDGAATVTQFLMGAVPSWKIFDGCTLFSRNISNSRAFFMEVTRPMNQFPPIIWVL